MGEGRKEGEWTKMYNSIKNNKISQNLWHYEIQNIVGCRLLQKQALKLDSLVIHKLAEQRTLYRKYIESHYHKHYYIFEDQQVVTKLEGLFRKPLFQFCFCCCFNIIWQKQLGWKGVILADNSRLPSIVVGKSREQKPEATNHIHSHGQIE